MCVIYSNQEIQNYQRLQEYPDAKGVTIQNRTLFDNLCNYSIVYSVEHNGNIKQKGEVELSLKSGDKKHFELPFISPDKEGIYTFNVSIVLKDNSKWATIF